MPEAPDETLDPGERALLSEADALIRGRRNDTVELAVQKPAESAPRDTIPVLTDLVARGRPRVPRERAPASGVAQQEAIEAILARIETRLDLELPALVERRVLRELSASIDYAIAVIGRDLETTLRAWIREAIAEVVRGEPPRPDGTVAAAATEAEGLPDAAPPA